MDVIMDVITEEYDVMHSRVGRFTLPESKAAQDRWSQITGLAPDSAEWGEVWQVLDDTGLLDADRMPQRFLFDDPSFPLGEGLGLRNLRLAIEAGALLHQHRPLLGDHATAVAVVAALLDTYYADMHSWTYPQALNRLEVELPRRVLYLADSPSAALAWYMDPIVHELKQLSAVEAAAAQPDLAAIVAEIAGNDEFAVNVFARLASTSEVALVALSYGGWLVYSCHPQVPAWWPT